jgi:hypothetical protein
MSNESSERFLSRVLNSDDPSDAKALRQEFDAGRLVPKGKFRSDLDGETLAANYKRVEQETAAKIIAAAQATQPAIQPATKSKALTAVSEQLSGPQIAERYDLPINALTHRLKWFRDNHAYGWMEVPNDSRRPRDARFIYALRDVMPIIEALKTAGGRQAKKK